MASVKSFVSKFSPLLLSILRIVVGLLFLEHGSQKLFDFPAPLGMPLKLASLTGLSAIIEFFGGLFIFLGFYTRIAAFIASGEMAVAYFMVHAPKGFWPLLNMGELAIVYCFVFLYLAFAGGGPFGLDGLRGRK